MVEAFDLERLMSFGKFGTVQEMLAEAVRRSAESVALTVAETGRDVSYAEMQELWMQSAGLLRAQGVNPGDRVVLSLENGIEYILAWGGILFAGGVPVLINPSAASDQLAELAAASSARVAVAVKGIHGVVALEQKHFSPEALANLPAIGSPDDVVELRDELAYIIFTSGTSGKMKGTRVTHGNVLSELAGLRQAYRLSREDVHLCVLPLFHASALFRNFLMPFSLGSRVILEREFDAQRFWDCITKYGVAFVQVVPTIISLLLRSPLGPVRGACPTLRYVGSASAPCPDGLGDKFEARFGVPVFQGYGLTETTCGVAMMPPEAEGKRRGSVGLPIPGAHIVAVDDQGAALPPGVEGEIVVSGPMVSPGYIEGTGPTRSRLGGGQIYTDDLGFVDGDGYVYITGRKTDLIYRGGFKISPKEVEEALALHESVEFAVVFGVPHDVLGEDLIAYVSPRHGAEFSERAVRAFLRSNLIRYKVPTRILAAPELFADQKFKTRREFFRTHYLEAKGRSGDVGCVAKPVKLRSFLSGDRIYLRPMQDDDSRSKVYLDNIMTAEFQRYTLAGRFPQSERSIGEYWSSHKIPDSMVMAICKMETGEHVGNFTLRIDWVSRHAEFGRMIFKEFQHEDYSTEAMRLVMRYVFEDLRLNRMWGGGGNPSSIPSLLRLGFTHEGRMRQHGFLGGKWRDLFIMGLLADEYFAIKEGRRLPQSSGALYSQGIFSRVASVVADVFDLDEQQVLPSTGPAAVEGWDSLGMILLWSQLEEVFGVHVDADDMIGVTCVGDIAIVMEGAAHG